ncbi:MAG TPA: hypothetical protein VFR72_03710 [Gemmatimonadales bacterium]|nr:hypothetical protein [Gemmatimonadales bacterium]
MTRSWAMGVLALGAAACGGGSRVEIDPNREVIGTRWNATLATSKQLAGALQVKGTGWMAGDDGDATKTRAFAAIENAVPGGEHPWHVHVGRCGTDRGIFGPAEAYRPLRVGGNGRAEASAELPVPVPTSGEYFVNIHASVNNMGTIVACGNLAPPSR